jgi:hypothetical protein
MLANMVAVGIAASSGWHLVRQLELPRLDGAGLPMGGFSAIHYRREGDQLWLLSDLPNGRISIWTGLARQQPPRPVFELALGQQLPGDGRQSVLDGEAMVLLGHSIWIASEGRRSAERPAELLAFNRSSGTLTLRVALPEPWQATEGRGLASNGGPEALAALTGRQGRPELLMAAEKPLLQDPPDQVRLLRWWWPAGSPPQRPATPQASEQGALRLPEGDHWGLTDLLVLPNASCHGQASAEVRLLALLRRFSPPNRWENRLTLYPLPPPGGVQMAEREWNLQSLGLTPDNWEGLSQGPPLADGTPTLLLVSDDNLNPLQANRLAILTADRSSACMPSRR